MKRALIAIMALLAWGAASNHCALAALASCDREPQCPFHAQAPGDQAPSNLVCCKILKSTVPAVALAAPVPPLTLAFLFSELTDRSLQARPQVIAAVDTGPPRTFAELVLQRSLFAHAPPARA